ncbi:MAG: isoamylase early set domain-containing protein [Candidatus Cloacimonetes bacterium]|nr:isoamylase early set domain-containing protein [Candidatus Cloacimonadota bacterium]
MSLEKKYLKSRPICKVTFRLPQKAAGDAETVNIVGDFNNWNRSADKMTRLKSGDYKISLNLTVGKTYEYRYLINGCLWENDWYADEYRQSPVSHEENSVVIV